MQRIVCAANRSLNKVNDTHYIVLGARHFDNIMRKQIVERFSEKFCKSCHWEQGFIVIVCNALKIAILSSF